MDIDRGELSKSMAKSLSLINIFVPFDHGVKFVKDLLGYKIPKRTLQNISYKTGDILKNYHQQNMTSDENIKLLESEFKEVDVEYFFTDGGQTPLLEKIENGLIKGAKKGNKTKQNRKKVSKKNEKNYRETKLGVFFSSNDVIKKKSKSGKERVEIKNKRFVSSLAHGLDHFKKAVQKASQVHKVFQAKVLVFISDGSEWCKTIQRSVFPHSIRILDWFHATEHLWEAAIKFFGEVNKVDYTKWAKPIEDMLWNGKISLVLKMIKDTIDDTSKNQTPLRKLYNYYDSNKDAMNYKKNRDKGYFIGSGIIESAVKYILTTRLKQTGCHWRANNAESLIWLRSKYFEDRWDDFWDKMNYRNFMKGKNLYDLVA